MIIGHFPRIVRSSGFTLIELMVAMAIFSMMAVVAYAGLNQVIQAQKSSDDQSQALKELVRGFSFVERDLRQMSPKTAHQRYGEQDAALQTELFDENVLEFSVGGVSQLADETRSSLQRVRYELAEATLFRRVWSEFHQSDSDEGLRMQIMSHVSEVSFRFMSDDRQWQNTWNNLGEEQESVLPRAIEVVVNHERFGEIKRIFPIYY